MFARNLLSTVLLVLAVLFAQVGSVAAAPQLQDGTTTTITGTINSITTEVDENGETVVLVTVEGEAGIQTLRLSAQEAADNQLFDLETETLLAQAGDPVELVVDPNDLVPTEEPAETDVHLISSLLANFFFDGDAEMASLIDSFHTGENEAGQVFGFGVIAQALWMSKGLNEGTADAELAGQILFAKKSGDFSAFELPDGSSPSNWGQFKKALRENKKKQNLGVIVSGQADETEDSVNQQDNGNGKGNGKGKGKDNGKGKNKNKP
jgi:hypothetical protein